MRRTAHLVVHAHPGHPQNGHPAHRSDRQHHAEGRCRVVAHVAQQHRGPSVRRLRQVGTRTRPRAERGRRGVHRLGLQGGPQRRDTRDCLGGLLRRRLGGRFVGADTARRHPRQHHARAGARLRLLCDGIGGAGVGRHVPASLDGLGQRRRPYGREQNQEQQGSEAHWAQEHLPPEAASFKPSRPEDRSVRDLAGPWPLRATCCGRLCKRSRRYGHRDSTCSYTSNTEHDVSYVKS